MRYRAAVTTPPTPTFFWHDYETFGAEPRRSRPAQFAGVRTDAELNEIDEPVMIHCRPAPDFLPDPGSVLITGITPQQALQRGLSEREFALAIERELARPGTIGVGYNSIRFDDEVTRFLLWRNLADPYAREWQNHCGRWDLIDVVRLTWALRPDGIQWPVHESGEWAGRVSFRLEHLTRANGIAHEGAHDALADVRATLGLARLIRRQQPRLWDFCLKLHRKDGVKAQIASGRPFLHLSSQYPLERGRLAIVWALAPHPRNANEVIVWDLAEDPRQLLELDAATLRRRLFTKADSLPPGETRLPMKTLHLNRSPMVASDLRVLQGPAARFGLDLQRALAHAEHAPSVGAALQGLWPEVYLKPDAADALPVDVDEDLYGGFLGPEDRRQLQRLRELDGAALAGRRPAFADGRLEELCFRYRARNFPDTLDADDQARWQAHRHARLIEGEGGALTLQAYLERIDELAERAIETDDERAQSLLEALVDYGESIAPESP